MKTTTYKLIFFFLVCCLIIEFFLLKDFPFFWDGISKSIRADWIYNQNFSQLIVPTEINSGHPPLWIVLIASFWSVLGKTLASARILLLFVNIAVVYQLIVLCKTTFLKNVSLFFIVLLFIEPTFIAQTTNLNNDMLLLFFSLLSLNGLLKQKNLLLCIGLAGVLFTNLRGVYIFVSIGLIDFMFYKQKYTEQLNKFRIYSYLIPILLFALFSFFQYKTLGWFLITENEGFANHRQTTSVTGIVKNSLAFLKSFLDYGRIVVLAICLPLLFKYFKSGIKNKTIDKILIITLVFTAVFFIGIVPFSNPIGDRYFLVCYLLIFILTINLIHYLKPKAVKLVTAAILIAFASGHFWIYPSTLSQSWDSSLAYLNYYKVERKMESYLENRTIAHRSVGTRLDLNSRHYSRLIELEGNELYAPFNLMDNTYVLLSNIDNETKDEALTTVKTNWEHIKSFSNLGVYISLYKKRN